MIIGLLFVIGGTGGAGLPDFCNADTIAWRDKIDLPCSSTSFVSRLTSRVKSSIQDADSSSDISESENTSLALKGRGCLSSSGALVAVGDISGWDNLRFSKRAVLCEFGSGCSGTAWSDELEDISNDE